jgi:predicted kinase
MITLISASAARKESELNMKFAAAKQWEEIENKINMAIRAGEFLIILEEELYENNHAQLVDLGYKVTLNYESDDDWCWKISW